MADGHAGRDACVQTIIVCQQVTRIRTRTAPSGCSASAMPGPADPQHPRRTIMLEAAAMRVCKDACDFVVGHDRHRRRESTFLFRIRCLVTSTPHAGRPRICDGASSPSSFPPLFVIPAKAGIQWDVPQVRCFGHTQGLPVVSRNAANRRLLLDSRLRGNDEKRGGKGSECEATKTNRRALYPSSCASKSLTLSITTKVLVCSTWGRDEMISPRTWR